MRGRRDIVGWAKPTTCRATMLQWAQRALGFQAFATTYREGGRDRARRTFRHRVPAGSPHVACAEAARAPANAECAKKSSTPRSKERSPIATSRADAPHLRRPFVKASALLLSLAVSAGLLSAAIASPSYPWFGWITPLPLLLAVRLMRPLEALAGGAFWGAGLFLLLAHGDDASIAQTFQSLALLSVIPAIYACWASWFTRRFGFASSALLLGFMWAVVEIALTPLGLDGGLLSGTHAQADGSLVHSLAGVVGYVFIAALVTTANGLLFSMVTRACVPGCTPRRYARSSAKTQRRFFPQEVPVHPFASSGPAQPRAPPA